MFLFLLFKRKKESLKVKFIPISETRFSKVKMQFIKIEVLKCSSQRVFSNKKYYNYIMPAIKNFISKIV